MFCIVRLHCFIDLINAVLPKCGAFQNKKLASAAVIYPKTADEAKVSTLIQLSKYIYTV